MKELLLKILANIKAGKMKINSSLEGKNDEEAIEIIKAEIIGNREDKSFEEKLKEVLTGETLKAMLDKESLDEIKKMLTDFIDSIIAKQTASAQAEIDKEAVKADESKKAEDAKKADAEKKVEDQIKAQAKEIEMLKIQASNTMLENQLSVSGLDVESQKIIRERFAGKVSKEDEVVKAIQAHKTYLDKLLASNNINGKPVISMGNKNEISKKEKLLAVFIDPSLNREEGYNFPYAQTYKNLRDAINDFAGHMRFEGVKTMQAAASSDFTYIFQDVMNKQVQKQYDLKMVDSAMKKLVDEVPIDTLDEQHIYDVGGFPLISDVSENASYVDAATPSDIDATYTPKKVGNTFTITEEMMYTSGDKVTQLVRLFPKNLASAAKVTLQKYVFDKITGYDSSAGINTQLIYDGLVLYHATHANKGANALDYSYFYTAYSAMVNQTKLSSSIPAEIEPRYLLVPMELLPTAINICKGEVYPSQTSNGVAIQNPYAGLGVEPIGVPNYYLGAGTTYWFLIANKNGFPTVQVGYFQDQRVPQIFLQNDPMVATVFSADQWKWKVKWRFGAAVTDYRAFYGYVG